MEMKKRKETAMEAGQDTIEPEIMGLPATYCVFASACGTQLALEHNGDVYCCDHFVYEPYRLGNLMDISFEEMLQLPAVRDFHKRKGAVSEQCRSCEYLFACRGECPKNRILPGGKNILCRGYWQFFSHIRPAMDELTAILRRGGDPKDIMRS